jgi:hypothetical protein
LEGEELRGLGEGAGEVGGGPGYWCGREGVSGFVGLVGEDGREGRMMWCAGAEREDSL